MFHPQASSGEHQTKEERQTSKRALLSTASKQLDEFRQSLQELSWTSSARQYVCLEPAS
jgi:hypothetical protein